MIDFTCKYVVHLHPRRQVRHTQESAGSVGPIFSHHSLPWKHDAKSTYGPLGFTYVLLKMAINANCKYDHWKSKTYHGPNHPSKNELELLWEFTGEIPSHLHYSYGIASDTDSYRD